MRFRIVIFFLSCFIFIDQCVAQKQGTLVEKSLQSKKIPFTITQFSTKNGLPQNQVNRIIPKNDGSLILYTSNGIVSFNGYEFKEITTDPGYKKQFFINLHYLKDKNKLIGLDERNRLYTLWPEYKEFKLPNVIPYFSDLTHDSLFVISSNRDIYLLNLTTNQTQLFFKNNSNYLKEKTVVVRASLFCNSKLYLATNKGLYTLDLKTKELVQLSKSDFNFLKTNPFNNKIYGLANNTLYIINNNKTEDSVSFKKNVPPKIGQSIAFVNSNTYFIATINGLFFVKDKAIRYFGKEAGLPSVFLHTLYMDTIHNCLFVGSSEKGLLKLQFKNNYTVFSKEGLPESSIGSIIKTKDNRILTSVNGLIYTIQDDTSLLYIHTKGQYACLAEINGLIYAGTWGAGVMIYKGTRLTDSLTSPENLPHPIVHSCYQDSKGTIWIGTAKGIANGENNNAIKPLLTDLIKERVICFYELKNGDICVGCGDGCYIIRNKKVIKQLNSKDGLNIKEVRSFYEDTEGKIWMGSYDGGLYCYDKNKLTSINSMKNCMLYRDAFCIVKDKYGYLYMTSNYGLWKVSEKSLNDFYTGKLSYLIPFHYNEETGILNTEFNGGFQNNYLKTEDGRFYFPTLEGVVVSFPEYPSRRKLNATIDNIYINDTLVKDSSKVFKRSTYSVQFDFACNNFTTKHNVYFQHRLTGEKNYEWSIPQKQTTVYLKMLPPGKYTFWVRTIDGFNDIDPQGTTYTFEIKPYIYETLWFKLTTTLLIIILIAIAVWQGIISQKRKIEQKEFYKRKISEVELNAIQAQLNPHFIFNCMNTIKYFILEKDFVNANDGLNRLSKLIRSSLENSEDMFVPIEQELTYITNYVELEKMRLQHQLEYVIHIDPAIEKSALVPHLLIQPYVENAIKHGIANLEQKTGNLSVDFLQTDLYIVCIITDNGIGRTASKNLNTRNEFHVSKGTELSKEKSYLLNQYYNYKCTIEVIDLYNTNHTSNGTKVIVKMPK